MGHRLTSTATTPNRTLQELLTVLSGEFGVCEHDHEKGDLHIDQMVAHWQKMLDGFSRWKTPPAETTELRQQITKFNGLKGNAAFVLIADEAGDADKTISFNLIPNEEILIGYADELHEQQATPVTLRLADVLHYDASLI